MSKIDVSDEIIEDGWGYTVKYKGRLYNYFASRVGAEAYLEVLKGGEGPDNGEETGTLPEVHGVL